MYRVLAAHEEVRERVTTAASDLPQTELLATAPNQVWSWDITKLRGPVKWTYFYLYVVLDIYSRCVVGWMIAERESAQLAQELVEAAACGRVSCASSSRCTPTMAEPCAPSHGAAAVDLGITQSHNRPHTSDDNPFSEAQFKTLKYRPDYPDRFGWIQDARTWARPFFHWYNEQHYHTGLNLLTPASVHFGQAAAFANSARR